MNNNDNNKLNELEILSQSDCYNIVQKTLNVDVDNAFQILSHTIQRRANTSGYLGDYYQLEITIEVYF